MWQAVRDKDWANFERRLSPTFIGVNADGQMFDRAGWLEHWKSAQVTEFSLGEVQVQPEGPDMKVTYVFHCAGSGGWIGVAGGGAARCLGVAADERPLDAHYRFPYANPAQLRGAPMPRLVSYNPL